MVLPLPAKLCPIRAFIRSMDTHGKTERALAKRAPTGRRSERAPDCLREKSCLGQPDSKPSAMPDHQTLNLRDCRPFFLEADFAVLETKNGFLENEEGNARNACAATISGIIYLTLMTNRSILVRTASLCRDREQQGLSGLAVADWISLPGNCTPEKLCKHG